MAEWLREIVAHTEGLSSVPSSQPSVIPMVSLGTHVLYIIHASKTFIHVTERHTDRQIDDR